MWKAGAAAVRGLGSAQRLQHGQPFVVFRRHASSSGGSGGGSGGSGGSRMWGRFVKTCIYAAASPVIGYVVFYTYSDFDKDWICYSHLARPKELPLPADFFGREEEVEALQRALRSVPERILILTGPSDTGKSTLLNKVLDRRPMTIKIDLRAWPITSVHDFCCMFNEFIGARFLQWRTWLMDWMPVQGTYKYSTRNRLSMVDLHRSLATLTNALKAAHAERVSKAAKLRVPLHEIPLPVICFDEFGTLLDFVKKNVFKAEDTLKVVEGADEARELVQSLLSWAVHITKDLQIAHVVISASDVFVIDALNKFDGVEGRTQFLPVGDLTGADAGRYLRRALPELPERDAAAAVRALGGRFLDLTSFVAEYRARAPAAPSSTAAARQVLEAMRAAQRERFLAALRLAPEADEDEEGDGAGAAADAEGPRWRWRHLYDTLALLAATPSGAVPYKEALARGCGNDAAALAALIGDDLLGFRAARTKDMDEEASAGDVQRDYADSSFWVTCDSPLALAAAREIVADPAKAAYIAARRKQEEEAEAAAAGRRTVVSLAREREQLAAAAEAVAHSAGLLQKLRPVLTEESMGPVLRARAAELLARQRALAEEEAAFTAREAAAVGAELPAAAVPEARPAPPREEAAPRRPQRGFFARVGGALGALSPF